MAIGLDNLREMYGAALPEEREHLDELLDAQADATDRVAFLSSEIERLQGALKKAESRKAATDSPERRALIRALEGLRRAGQPGWGSKRTRALADELEAEVKRADHEPNAPKRD